MTARRNGRFDAIVIGGGHNGLVCAAYLARGGMRTLVLERRARVGGSVATAELMPGVRVPLLAHSVGRLRPSVARDLGLAGHGLRLVSPAVRSVSLQPDATPMTLWRDAQRTAAELDARGPSGDGAAYAGFDRQTRSLSGLLARIMAMTPPDPSRPGVSDALSAMRLGLGYRSLGTQDGRAFLRVLPMPIADHVEDWFQSEALRAALAWRGVRYSAMGPRDAGSTQTFLAETAGTHEGAGGEMVVVRGGPGALADALAAAVTAAGSTIRTSVTVASVATRGDRASGVVLADGEEIEAAVVVSGLDPKHTLLRLLDPALPGPHLGWQAGNLRLKGAVAKVNLALAGVPAFRGFVDADDARSRLRGRIMLAPSVAAIDRAADAVKAGRVAEHPVLEATIPSLVDASLVDDDAPARHVMSVLVQGTPYHRREGDWDTERDALGDRVLAELETVAPGIGAQVVDRQVLTPLDLERDHGLTEGHPLHGEPALDQWFAWRPLLGFASYRLPVDGLYLCASGAHPGGGVTGWPGQNAAREVLADRKRRPDWR
ncbi:MAG: NAD(P)/FAD-dependent oxidoreductase [Chloroflexota bacterium]|nr:NAD(P)/FAD-dependent oxidoreductase [Chloroflexota bacterium]